MMRSIKPSGVPRAAVVQRLAVKPHVPSWVRARRLALGLLVATVAACNKPEMDDCRKALDNMQHILGTENISKNGDNEGDVRRCRGGSTREAVQCAIKATSKDDLARCDFMKTPHKKPADGDGSAAGSGSDRK